MANKTWDELRVRLMKSPSFQQEYEKLRPQAERVKKVHRSPSSTFSFSGRLSG
jgi:hypothetical protein